MSLSRLHILLFLFVIPCALLRGQWYDSYEKGREAVKKGQWPQAVRHLTDAINEEPDSKARKKTYGLTFIDYFPYLYRGIAYYRLNDLTAARTDIEKAEHEGVIRDANEDGDASALLSEYMGYIQKSAPPTAQQKAPETPQQKTPQLAVQKPPVTPDQGAPRTDSKKSEAANAAKKKKDDVEKALASGVEYFRVDDLDRAETEFKNVLAIEPSNKKASEFLGRIETKRRKLALALREKETPPVPRETARVPAQPAPDTAGSALFHAAVALFNEGNVLRAKSLFRSVNAVAPGYQGLDTYMGLIASLEERAHTGIAAYFRGEYREAIEKLRESSKNGTDNPHVYAILACSYAAEYLLAGSDDGKLKKEAVEAYGRVKGINPRYELDAKVISPGIIAVVTGE